MSGAEANPHQPRLPQARLHPARLHPARPRQARLHLVRNNNRGYLCQQARIVADKRHVVERSIAGHDEPNDQPAARRFCAGVLLIASGPRRIERRLAPDEEPPFSATSRRSCSAADSSLA
jgi:hypothetical protein